MYEMVLVLVEVVWRVVPINSETESLGEDLIPGDHVSFEVETELKNITIIISMSSKIFFTL